MALRPAYWVGTTIRSHRVPAGGEHRATSRRSATTIAPYAAASVAAIFLAFSVIVGFTLPTGVVAVWESPPGNLLPLDPPDISTPTPPTEEGSEGRVLEEADRASRSRSRPADPPEQPAPVDAPQPPGAAPATAAAPRPLVTVMPTPNCPPPLPPAAKSPKVSHPPRGPKVQLAPTPSPRREPSRGGVLT